jgi:NADPH:quinone reductase-like Zn-dependent oxidoreductase
MKAIVYEKYGPPEVLQLKEVAKPTPKDNEVLIKVHAASLNYADWAFVRGKPVLGPDVPGAAQTKNTILGADIAGRIEAIGRNIKQFQKGDEVFGEISGCGFGAFSEYVSVPENALALKPANMTFEEAAAVPQAAIVALQGLRNKGQIQPGQKVLINGASGGIGTFAVQIAKSSGAEVTGVCSTRNLDMVRSIGADHVIDYTQEDFTQSGETYDVIFDIVGKGSFSGCIRSLKQNGRYLTANPGFPRRRASRRSSKWVAI